MLCWLLLVSALEGVSSLQIPLQDNAPSLVSSTGRKLQGRFLQVTDFHPDPFYKLYSSITEDGACHRGSGPAGYYGAETSDCDSPISLINATFDWIRDNVKDQIDFVIWTGDSARHDNDEKLPRNTAQVVELNQLLVHKFYEVFGKSGDDPDDEDPTNDLIIPVVPTLGNNDILPHNIFERGPNTWTRRYLDVWQTFIPEVQKHQFDQGGWFYVEVIPNRLAVFSLNSLYFFNSNSAVDGCAAKSEPGYRQLDWLRIQLQYLRERNMKAILIGHVPPARTANKHNWDETCWQKYALWMRQYRDVVAATLYGHMNTDHFIVQDFNDINDDVLDGYEIVQSTKRSLDTRGEEQFHAQSATSYLLDLKNSWTKLPQPPSRKSQAAVEMIESIEKSSDEARPDWEIANLIEEYLDAAAGTLKKGKKDKKHKDRPHDPEDYTDEIGGQFAERFAVSHVSPSVVPNYFPTIRIYEYNITGLDFSRPAAGFEFDKFEEAEQADEQEETTEADDDLEAEKKKKKKKKPKKHRFTVPKPPSNSAPPGPAYSPQTLSLLGFVQYYANLTRINNDFHNETALDYVEEQGWKEGKHKGKKPYNGDHEPNPKNFTYEVLYDTRGDKVYDLPDLTTKSYLRLAQRIADFKPEKHSLRISEADGEEGEEDIAFEDGEDEDDLNVSKKKSKKHKGDKKQKKPRKANKPWYTFVRRAFVHTVDPEDIREQFGR